MLKTETEKQIEYKGKRTQRSRGHERREAILRAALKIIARDGVRAVRHRAVAKEAEVPLAATTYYFKDINELIYDAFAYFATEGDKLKAKLEEKSFAALASVSLKELQNNAVRNEFIERLTEVIAEHVYDQVQMKDDRMVEHAFNMRALYDAELSRMRACQRKDMRDKIAQFLEALGMPDCDKEAEAFLALILHLEYELLSARLRRDEEPDVRGILKHFIAGVFNNAMKITTPLAN